jgi:hypothetical protein
VHRDRVAPDELRKLGDVWVTGPVRTAYDLARCSDLVEAVVAVDRLANAHRFAPDLLLHLAANHPRARGNARIPDVLAHANPYTG